MDAVRNNVSPASVQQKPAPEVAKPTAVKVAPEKVGLPPNPGSDTRSVNGIEKPSLNTMSGELQESVRSANERLAVYNQRLDIAIDGATGAIVVKVSDSDTGETLRQIPSEEALRITRNIDSLTGILVDQKE
jgi:flagellar protein FlaG